MDQTYERVAPGIYTREYRTATNEKSVLYYGRLKCSAGGKRIWFALGKDFAEAKDQ